MAHTSELLDYTTNAFIVKDKQVLLVFNKTYNSWFGPGGHIEKDEDIQKALFREIEEETGISRKELQIILPPGNSVSENIFSDMTGEVLTNPHHIDIHQVSPTHHHLAFRYFFKTTANFTGSQDASVTKLKWFSLKELDDPKYNLKKHVKFYAKEAIKLSQYA